MTENGKAEEIDLSRDAMIVLHTARFALATGRPLRQEVIQGMFTHLDININERQAVVSLICEEHCQKIRDEYAQFTIPQECTVGGRMK